MEIEAKCLRSYFYVILAECKLSRFNEAQSAFCRAFSALSSKRSDSKWAQCIEWLQRQREWMERKRARRRKGAMKREPVSVDSTTRRPSKRRKRNNEEEEHGVDIDSVQSVLVLHHDGVRHREKAWKCKYCPYRAESASVIERHEKIHERPVPHKFECRRCSYSAQNRPRLEEHERLHRRQQNEDGRPLDDDHGASIGVIGRRTPKRKRPQFAVKEDPASSEEEESLLSDGGSGSEHSEWSGSARSEDEHQRDSAVRPRNGGRYHGDTESAEEAVGRGGGRSFECIHCFRCFGSRSVLEEHFKAHSAERPLKCPHCDKRFVQKNHLTSHLRIHDPPDDSFLCAPCSVSFRNKTQLKRHRRNVDCLWRQNEQEEKAEMKQRGRYNVEDEPAKCPICNKKFQKKKYMVMHMESMHCDPTPHACHKSGCNKKFKMEQDLLHHLAIEH